MNTFKIKKIGGHATADMIESKDFNHGERSMKIRKKYFRSLKRKLNRLITKFEGENN